MSLPDPPYTYDDPRLTYDEHCFFYDGGYDDVCLAGPTAIVIKKGGYKKRTREPELPWINIFIQSRFVQANNIFLDEKEKITRFAGKDAPITIFVNGVQFDTRYPYVKGEIIKTLKEKPDLNASIRFVEKIENKSDEEIMAENLKSSIEAVELQVVEDYQKIKVEAKLIVEKSDIEVKSTLIKEKP